MSLIILAGGRGTRLGKEKASLVIDGTILLQRTIQRLSQVQEEIILVLAQGQTPPRLDSSTEVKMITDTYQGKGPMVGIYSGLRASSADYGFVVGCDMPFLNTGLLRYMIGLVPGFDIVIPKISNLMEPLHAIYTKNCLADMEDLIRKEGPHLNPLMLMDRMRVRCVEESEIDVFDPEHLSFFNINTPYDLEKARQLMAREGASQ